LFDSENIQDETLQFGEANRYNKRGEDVK
jgi:hypothetical protein